MHETEAAPCTLPPQEETVIQIPLSKLHPFPNHPFKLRDDDAMREMMESVRQYGVLAPAIIRPREAGDYELISGHRRKHACEAAGLKTLPAIVRDMDDDAAIILMVDSNIQRENVLPSEKAAALKMKLAAIRRQAGRPSKGNSGQVGRNFCGKESRQMIAEQTGVSARQVQRYINLTKLCPELLDLVDKREIAFNAAVELSHLNQEEQSFVAQVIHSKQVVPTLAQALQMKKTSQKSGLDRNAIASMLAADAPPRPAVQLSADKQPPDRPDQVQERASVPSNTAGAQPRRERKPQIADDILRLKDTTKECRCTPEIFLTAFSELADRFRREIEVFTIPYYEAIFPNLSPKELDALRQQVDALRAVAEVFYQNVKGMNVHEE